MFGNIVRTFKTSSKLAIISWIVLLAVIPIANIILVKPNIINTKNELLSLGQIQSYNMVDGQRVLANYLVGLHCQGRKLYYFKYDNKISIINVHGNNDDMIKNRVSVCSYRSELMEATIFLFALILFTLFMSNYEEIINKIWINTKKRRRRNSIIGKISILFFCFLIVYQFMSILVTLGFLFLL